MRDPLKDMKLINRKAQTQTQTQILEAPKMLSSSYTINFCCSVMSWVSEFLLKSLPVQTDNI